MASPFDTPEFLALKAEWDARLQAEGFDDIEGADGQLAHEGASPITWGRPEYYQRCQEALSYPDFVTTFSPREQKLLRLHAEGVSERGPAGRDYRNRNRNLINRFRAYIGAPSTWPKNPAPEVPPPAPCRTLTRQEIDALYPKKGK